MLTDLTYIDDANSTILDNSMINFEKARMVADVNLFYYFPYIHQRQFHLMNGLSSAYHNLIPNPSLQSLLQATEIWNENEAFTVSRLREPSDPEDSEVTKVSRIDSRTFANLTKSVMQKSDVGTGLLRQ